MSEETKTVYGPSAIATPANVITLVRMALAPILLIILLNDTTSYLPLVIWVILAISDGADGYVARRQGVTRSGAFLDPLADKILVFCALAGLVALGRVELLPVLIMGVREVVVSIYRMRVLADGKSLPARWVGKIKMNVQILAVGLALIPGFTTHLATVETVIIWFATALAVVSAVQYFVDSKSVRA